MAPAFFLCLHLFPETAFNQSIQVSSVLSDARALVPDCGL